MSALRRRCRQRPVAVVLDGKTKAPQPAKNSLPVRSNVPVQLDLPFDLPPRGPRQSSSAKTGCQNHQETWLPIPGYERAYSISNMGRVRTEPRTYVSKNGVTKTVKARFLKCGATGKGGYPRFSVSVNDVSRVLYVHQIVMLAFVGPPPEGKKFSTMTVTP